VKSILGVGMLSRQHWVEVCGAAADGAGRPRAPKARSPWALPEKFFLKIDCRKGVFQAFQALSSHFEGAGNSKETAG